ncbi:MAG: sulfatase-like hydrolase/transferase [Candidatus Hydrogenedentes bacterium]|nr:sulfatase-like hydrolase/transferase [Candidatus Hydrogenedentota bacterium]
MGKAADEGTGVHALLVVISTSVSLGLVDVILTLPRKPDAFSTPFSLCLPAAATMLISIIGFGLFWACAILPFNRLLKKEPSHLLWRGAVLVVVAFVLARLTDVIQIQAYGTHGLDAILRLSIVLLVAAWAGRRSLPLPPESQWACVCLVAFPYVLCQLMLGFWFILCAAESPLLLGVMTGAILITTTMTLVLAARCARLRVQMAALTVLSLAILGGGITAFRNLEPARVFAAAPSTSNHRVPRVILITIDTLRRDAVGSYRAEGNETPAMDALARDGVRFTRAYSAAPRTLPAVTSIMTGVTADVHAAIVPFSRLSNEFVTMAEFMQQAGYLTGALGCNVHLTEHMNLQQGFMDYEFYPKPAISDPETFGARILRKLVLNRRFPRKASSQALTEAACQWLEQHHDQDFFFWLHYFDPHWPYEPPPRFLPRDDTLIERFGPAFYDQDGAGFGLFGVTPDQRQWVRELYLAEVRYVDDCIGQIVQTLKRLGLYEDTLIILTTDHGEEFWDHDNFGHGHSLYNELIWTPLFIKSPNGAASSICEAPVSTAGLLPTLLDQCGISFDAARFSTFSYAAALQHPETSFPDAPIFSSGLNRYGEQESLVWENFKYIHSAISGRNQLFDLHGDPAEAQPLLSSLALDRAGQLLTDHRRRAEELRALYHVSEQQPLHKLPQTTVQELESLGYL